MSDQLTCPACQSAEIKRNGHIHNGKQNHQCKACGRQFVAHPSKKYITGQEQAMIDRLLLERISLAGICRVMQVSQTWLLDYVAALYEALPDDLNAQQAPPSIRAYLDDNFDKYNRQIIALHVGGRGLDDAWKLWESLPVAFRQQASFFTDFWKAYNIIDQEQHVAAGKDKGFVNHLERFNATLRQRCSRLVRKTLSFSKKQSNHVGAIRYFICHYNRHLALHL